MTLNDHERSRAAELHAVLKELFFRSIELDVEDRRLFVGEVRGRDAELGEALESLLSYHKTSDLPEDFNDG